MRVMMTSILPMLMAVMMLAGCDKASGPQEQDQTEQAPSSNSSGDQRADIAFESANGMTAVLSYAHAGSDAPSVPFTGADGRDVTLTDFSGRPLLVNIWATWCAPCKVEMPTVDALAEIEEGNMSVIAVSQDLAGRGPVLDFFKRISVRNLEPYTDADNALMAAFENKLKLPTTILYDSDGKEVWRVEGGLEWDDEAVAGLLREAS